MTSISKTFLSQHACTQKTKSKRKTKSKLCFSFHVCWRAMLLLQSMPLIKNRNTIYISRHRVVVKKYNASNSSLSIFFFDDSKVRHMFPSYHSQCTEQKQKQTPQYRPFTYSWYFSTKSIISHPNKTNQDDIQQQQQR